jgi:ABC-type sugar transport system permease subunit
MKPMMERIYQTLVVKPWAWVQSHVLKWLGDRIVSPVRAFLAKHVAPLWEKFKRAIGLKWLGRQIDKIPNRIKNAVRGYLFLIPWFLGFFMIAVPVLTRSVQMAFSDKYYFIAGEGWRTTGVWSDLTQFKRIFSSEPWHLEQIVFSIKDIALVVPLVVIFALILAMMLNQKIKGRSVFRTIFFIPVILLSGNMLSNFEANGLLTVPAIASGTIGGILANYFPEVFSEVALLAFQKIVLILWLSGVQILIFLAGLQKMDKQTYEAAEIDGASMWETFWKITLPALFPLMYINIIYTTIIYANLSNNPIVVLITARSSQQGSLTGTLSDEINYGRAYSAALSWVLFAIQVTIIGAYSGIVKLASKRYD